MAGLAGFGWGATGVTGTPTHSLAEGHACAKATRVCHPRNSLGGHVLLNLSLSRSTTRPGEDVAATDPTCALGLRPIDFLPSRVTHSWKDFSTGNCLGQILEQ